MKQGKGEEERRRNVRHRWSGQKILEYLGWEQWEEASPNRETLKAEYNRVGKDDKSFQYNSDKNACMSLMNILFILIEVRFSKTKWDKAYLLTAIIHAFYVRKSTFLKDRVKNYIFVAFFCNLLASGEPQNTAPSTCWGFLWTTPKKW